MEGVAGSVLCENRAGFAHAYKATYMEIRGINEVYSYDADFDRITGVSRVEPEG